VDRPLAHSFVSEYYWSEHFGFKHGVPGLPSQSTSLHPPCVYCLRVPQFSVIPKLLHSCAVRTKHAFKGVINEHFQEPDGDPGLHVSQ
jgi:hypothetical protein